MTTNDIRPNLSDPENPTCSGEECPAWKVESIMIPNDLGVEWRETHARCTLGGVFPSAACVPGLRRLLAARTAEWDAANEKIEALRREFREYQKTDQHFSGLDMERLERAEDQRRLAEIGREGQERNTLAFARELEEAREQLAAVTAEREAERAAKDAARRELSLCHAIVRSPAQTMTAAQYAASRGWGYLFPAGWEKGGGE